MIILRKESNHKKTTSPYFSLIYQAAITKNNYIITKFLEKAFSSIDIKTGDSFGLITPAGLLQMHGDNDAAEFLVAHGADVDYAGYGAALANDIGRAEYWRKLHGASPSMLAKGAAYAGNMEYAMWLYNKRGAEMSDIIVGLIMSGRIALAKYHVHHFDFKYTANAILEAIGIFAGGLTPEVNELISLLNIKSSEPYVIPHSVTAGAGISGKFYIRDPEIPSEGEFYDHSFYKGAIVGGHLQDIPINTLENTLVDNDAALIGSNTEYLEKKYSINRSNNLLTSFSTSFTIFSRSTNDKSFIKGISDKNREFYLSTKNLIHFTSHRQQSFKTLALLYELSGCKESPFGITSLYWFYKNEMDFLRNLVFSDSKKFNDHIVKTIIEWIKSAKDEDTSTDEVHEEAGLPQFSGKHSSYNHVMGTLIMSEIAKFDLEKLAYKANIMRKLMKKYEFNFDQALAIVNSNDLRNYLNTCRDITSGLSVDTCATIITFLADITLADAKGLVSKLKYHRTTIFDLLRIARDFDQCAKSGETRHSARAASIAAAISNMRNKDDAIKLLASQIEKMTEAKNQRAHVSGNNMISLVQSVGSFFSKTSTKALQISHLYNTPKHALPFDNVDDTDPFNAVVESRYNMLKQ